MYNIAHCSTDAIQCRAKLSHLLYLLTMYFIDGIILKFMRHANKFKQIYNRVSAIIYRCSFVLSAISLLPKIHAINLKLVWLFSSKADIFRIFRKQLLLDMQIYWNIMNNKTLEMSRALHCEWMHAKKNENISRA